MVQSAAIAAEGGTVGDAVAVVDAGGGAAAIDAVERAQRGAFAVVHAARPEAAGAIDLAVVEPVAGPVGLGIVEDLEQAGGRIWSSAEGRHLGVVTVLLPLKESLS